MTQLSFGQSEKVTLSKFSSSECETTLEKLKTRIISKNLKGNTLKVEIATIATCCVTMIPEISMEANTLHLKFQETGSACECDCYFTLTYVIKGIKDPDIKIKFQDKDIEFSLEKYPTFPIKFRILHSDTIDNIDKYGYRQGKWSYRNDSLMTTGYMEFYNDVVLKMVKFHPDRTISSVTSRDRIKSKDSNGKPIESFSNYNYYVEYFTTGQKKLECRSDNNTDSYKDSGKCKEWNENGVLVYEGIYKK